MSNQSRIEKLEREVASLHRCINALAKTIEDMSEEKKGDTTPDWVWDRDSFRVAANAIDGGFEWSECPYLNESLWDTVYHALQTMAEEYGNE